MRRAALVVSVALLALVPSAARQARAAQACVLPPRVPGDATPAWAPEGAAIAFTRVDHRGSRVAVVSLATRKVRIVGDGMGPAWSARGEIAFVREFLLPPLPPRPAECPPGVAGPCVVVTSCDDLVFQSDVFVAGADGIRPLIATSSESEYDAAWSPDGRRLAFTRRSVDPLTWRSRIIVATRGAPDGSRLVFHAYSPNERSQIVVARSDGTDRRAIARGSFPAWSPGGRTIAFTVRTARANAIFLVRPDGTRLRPLFARR